MKNLQFAFIVVSLALLAGCSSEPEAVSKLDVKVQFGGGLRDMDALQNAIDLGASRLVIGTLAIQNPDAVEESIQRFGADAICVALDAKDGKVTTHGWTELSEHTPIEFGRLFATPSSKRWLRCIGPQDIHRRVLERFTTTTSHSILAPADTTTRTPGTSRSIRAARTGIAKTRSSHWFLASTVAR